MTDIISAIKAINPKASVIVYGDDLKGINWLGDTTPISDADILAKQKELQTAYGVDEWKKTIKAVKDKYPKE